MKKLFALVLFLTLLAPICGQASTFVTPKEKFWTTTNTPLAGGTLTFYKPGTTTLKNVYSDKACTTAVANPYTLDAYGMAPPLYMKGQYKVTLKNSAGVVQPGWPVDNVEGLGTIDATRADIDADIAAGAKSIELTGNITLTSHWDLSAYTGRFSTNGHQINGAFTFTAPADFVGSDNCFGSTVTVTGTRSSNPRWWGAVGDGVTDDTVAIQAAFDAGSTQKGTVWIPRGNYLISASLVLRSALRVECEQGAIFLPNANNLTVFTNSGFTSSISVSKATISANSKTGITAVSLNGVGQDSSFQDCYFTGVDYGYVLTNIVGLRINNQTIRNCDAPVVANASTSAVVITAPNFDNSVAVGGSGTGIGINVTAVSQIKVMGGFIQGFEHGVQFATATGSLQVDSVYFESCTDAALYVNSGSGAIFTNNYFFGYGGNCMIKGRTATNCLMMGNRMNKSTATGGLYDFDATCSNNFEQHVATSAGINSTPGIMTGIAPLTNTTAYLKSTVTKSGTANDDEAFDAFSITVPAYSVTRVEVFIEAIEKTAYYASATKKFVFSIHNNGTAMELSAVADDTASSVLRSNASYAITPSITPSSTSATVAKVQITLTKGGATGFATAYYRGRVVAETSGAFVQVDVL